MTMLLLPLTTALEQWSPALPHRCRLPLERLPHLVLQALYCQLLNVSVALLERQRTRMVTMSRRMATMRCSCRMTTCRPATQLSG